MFEVPTPDWFQRPTKQAKAAKKAKPAKPAKKAKPGRLRDTERYKALLKEGDLAAAEQYLKETSTTEGLLVDVWVLHGHHRNADHPAESSCYRAKRDDLPFGGFLSQGAVCEAVELLRVSPEEARGLLPSAVDAFPRNTVEAVAAEWSMRDVIELAGYGCAYWAQSISYMDQDMFEDCRKRVLVVEQEELRDDYEEPHRRAGYVLTGDGLRAAAVELLALKGPPLRAETVKAILAYVHGDVGLMDPDDADLVVQWACFGEVVYG